MWHPAYRKLTATLSYLGLTLTEGGARPKNKDPAKAGSFALRRHPTLRRQAAICFPSFCTVASTRLPIGASASLATFTLISESFCERSMKRSI